MALVAVCTLCSRRSTGIGGITLQAAEHGDEEVGKLGQVALVHPAHDLEVLVGAVVEAVEVHLAEACIGHRRNCTKPPAFGERPDR